MKKKKDNHISLKEFLYQLLGVLALVSFWLCVGYTSISTTIGRINWTVAVFSMLISLTLLTKRFPNMQGGGDRMALVLASFFIAVIAYFVSDLVIAWIVWLV